MDDNLHIILNHYHHHVVENIIQNNERSGSTFFKCECGSTFKNMKNLKRHLRKKTKKHSKWMLKKSIQHMEESESYREICYTINSTMLLEHRQSSSTHPVQCKCHSTLKNIKSFKTHVHSKKHKEWLFEYILSNLVEERKEPYKIVCDCEKIVYSTNVNRHVRGRHHLRIVNKMNQHISGGSFIFKENSNVKCTYCNLPYTLHDTITVLPCCGCHFHRRCIYNWRIVQNDKKCPICHKYIPDNTLLSKHEHDTIGKCIFFKNSNTLLLSKLTSFYHDEITGFLRQLIHSKELIENSFIHIEDLIRSINNESVNNQFSRIISHYNIHIYPNIIEFITFIRELMNWIHECRLTTSNIWKNIRPHVVWSKENINYVDELNTYYNELWDYVTQIFTIDEETIINQGLGTSIERKEESKHSLQKLKYSPSKFKKFKMCVICLDSFSKGDDVSMTECLHCFHFDCIVENLHYSNDCPLCRKVIR